MTEQTKPLLFLPTLHEELCSTNMKTIASAQYFGVGLDLGAGQSLYYTPTNYPFSSAQAQGCLHDIKSMGEIALSGVPLQALTSLQTPHSQLQDLQEQAALENFMRTNQAGHDTKDKPSQVEHGKANQDVHILCAAQKFLLWAWLMKEYIIELQDLTQKYALNSTHILDALGVEDNPALSDLLQLQGSLADANFVLPPWHLVLENMAPFLPDECTVIINNDAMAAHILQIADVSPLSIEQQQALQINTNQPLCRCTVSIEQLLKNDSKQQKNTEHSAFGLTKKLHCILLQHGVA